MKPSEIIDVLYKQALTFKPPGMDKAVINKMPDIDQKITSLFNPFKSSVLSKKPPMMKPVDVTKTSSIPKIPDHTISTAQKKMGFDTPSNLKKFKT